ncbi:hypothetical protein PSECIP111854_00316 [Pseudoalteromonas sp. CIP111854]|uniref:Uncharacterized protein n=1 Tax=Pseudoalteromonas holothuriae TaxID=2963714 RepID=A0A9W4QR24_9GAMM|nr:hypothetical protein [Pseudoalteromonas sp. CIP111854]CAH9049669.1 hypothetical protein PSECIP111854_00316 [Pseudoalteromonas sp. CIP111854]
MSLNDFLYYLGWGFIGYELLIVLWFLVTQFPKHSWSLFFSRHQSLNSLQLHEMHSCFMSAVVFMLFHTFGGEVEQYLLSLEFKQINRIKVFYTGVIAHFFICLLTMYVVHRLRGCLFSKTARICMYMIFLFSALSFMELIARGYFDYHELGMVYRIGGWACNIIVIAALSIYPIRQTLAYFQTQREA